MEKQCTVLIAEDDYASRELLKNKLEEHRRKYITVEDGLAAIETIRANPDIRLVFMDIKLPEINGIEAMRQIKELRQNVIVIAQTAYLYSVERDKQIYLATGFDDFIEKPFNLDLVSELLDKYK